MPTTKDARKPNPGPRLRRSRPDHPSSNCHRSRATARMGAARQERIALLGSIPNGAAPLSRSIAVPLCLCYRQAAIILSALSMPSDRPNRCSAVRSQRALGSYSRSSLPALLLPAPEQGRFPGRPMAARLLIGNAGNVWAPDHRRLVSTQAPESGHDQSTEKGGPCHRERHGKSPRKPGPRSALHGSRHKPKARRPMSTAPRAAIAARLTGAEDLRFSCRLF